MCRNAGTPLPVGEGIDVADAAEVGDWLDVPIATGLATVAVAAPIGLGLAAPPPQPETITAAHKAPKASRILVTWRVYAPAGSRVVRPLTCGPSSVGRYAGRS
jgi:hypothetical protein